jgi:drug/metabolite transporter (DMT)-like permease
MHSNSPVHQFTSSPVFLISPKIKSNLILLLAAVIWGFAFVAQRVGMDFVGPFTFNGIRFALGSIVLLPFLLFRRKRQLIFPDEKNSRRKLIIGTVIMGFVLSLGISFQQIGLMTTTAGKAGFITGLYVIFVPIAGIFFGHKTRVAVWIGVALSAVGLYFLSITSRFTMAPGDFLVLLCAITFTGHVLLIAWLSPKMDSFFLAIVPFAICSFVNLILAFSFETIEWKQILGASVPLLYGGILSVGIAYTLQVVAQKSAHPAYASIILSLESVFAAFAGWLLLNEHLSFRSLVGCGLMLGGMIIVQLKR